MNKASYYVNEYANTLLLYYENGNERAFNDIITKIYLDLCNDADEICEMRHSKTANTLLGALRDTNNKWNAIRRGFEKRIGLPIIKENGFVNVWFDTMPEIKHLYEKRYGAI